MQEKNRPHQQDTQASAVSEAATNRTPPEALSFPRHAEDIGRFSDDNQMVVRPEAVFRFGRRVELAAVLDGDNVDFIFLTHIQIADGLTHKGGQNRLGT